MSARYERIDRDGWIRRDPPDEQPLDASAIHVTGPADASPYHRMYPAGYDSRCGWCYLNAPHSDNAHATRIEPTTTNEVTR